MHAAADGNIFIWVPWLLLSVSAIVLIVSAQAP